jgi:hypothetical protein
MSLLDDENILMENIKESCNFIKPLEEILEEFKITNTIDTIRSEKCGEFFNKLSLLKIDGYEWLRYFDRFILYNIETVSTVFVISFNKILQDYTGYFNCNYKINLEITKYNHDFSGECSIDLISLFDLNNNRIWEVINNFNPREDYIDPYTTYKYIKNATQLWYTR